MFKSLTKKHKSVLTLLAAVITVASVVIALRDHGKSKLRSETFQTNNGWGYRILLNDTAHVIDQPMIPGIPGNKGFKSQEDAQKTADLVIMKMKKGILPPAISVKELDSLGIK